MPQSWPGTLPAPRYAHDQQYSCGLSSPEDLLWPQQTRRDPDPDGSIAFVFDATQMAAFRTFFDTTLNGGSDWFTASWITSLATGADFARFVESYNATLIGLHWSVSGRLEYMTI